MSPQLGKMCEYGWHCGSTDFILSFISVWAVIRVAVKVELHSSSSGAGSDENLSSSDLSEHSADPENDYEEIYQSREENTAVSGVRRRSRDSGSHSRSSSSSNSHAVVVTSPPDQKDAPAQEEPSMTASTGT